MYLGNQLHALFPELLKERLRDVTPITKEFPRQGARQFRYRITVIHIARCYFYSWQFSLVIDDQVQLESIKLTHAALSPGSKLCHYFMRPNAAIVTHADPGGINKTDPSTLPKAAGQKTAQRHQATLHQLNQAVVAHQPWKMGPLILQHVIQVIVSKRPVPDR